VKRGLTLSIIVLLVAGASAAAATASSARRHHPTPLPSPVWYVETLAGEAVESQRGDDPINPASVVKVATSLWALEQLGPDFRYETRFFARGHVDGARRVLAGDLVVEGAGDPDFHAENAFLVAQALNDLGVERVTGALVVNARFWIGWENGSAGRVADPVRRGLQMAARLRQALDPKRWDWATRATWREFSARRGLSYLHPARVAVAGGIGTNGHVDGAAMLVVHRSEPLVDALRRFNCYSNNDIERVAAGLGSAADLAGLVAAKCELPADGVQIETASGLGSNRLTPHGIVRLLRELRTTCARTNVSVEALLPVAGCDPGTVTRFFPELSEGADSTAVVGKTGTLTNTDGGIAVLAGFVNTGSGEYAFCVAVPHAAGRLRIARKLEEQWLTAFIAGHGGGRPHTCAPALPMPDAEAVVIRVGTDSAASPTPTAAQH
jgi:serine-type D-Ala-D-Ala carboxypeptidase/endopeptidase (penicillin-binding protein 4)